MNTIIGKYAVIYRFKLKGASQLSSPPTVVLPFHFLFPFLYRMLVNIMEGLLYFRFTLILLDTVHRLWMLIENINSGSKIKGSLLITEVIVVNVL